MESTYNQKTRADNRLEATDTIQQGHALYEGHCLFCHGVQAIAASVPDLRYTSADVHAQFEEIVLGGTREALGMPGFGDLLDAEQVRAIQQYVCRGRTNPQAHRDLISVVRGDSGTPFYLVSVVTSSTCAVFGNMSYASMSPTS